MNNTTVTYKAYMFITYNERRMLIIPDTVDPARYCGQMNFMSWKPIQVDYFGFVNWN